MKTHILGLATGFGFVAACGGAPEVSDPYADLAEGTTLVRFEANPDIAPDQCNPNVHYAIRTDEEVIFTNLNIITGDTLIGTGSNLLNEDDGGIASTTSELSMFDPLPQPCSETEIKVQEFTCRGSDDDSSSPCPAPQFEGTDMFASFRGLPDY